MGAWLLLCSSIPTLVVGCSDAAAERESATGTVSVALTGVGSSGAVYRLRNGVFKITGKGTATASSEDNLDAPVIKVELKAGGYLANLVSGWTMEKQNADGTFQNVKAVLVSNNPLPFEIVDQQLTPVTFQFKAGDDVVHLGNGLAAIGIAVDDCGTGCAIDDQDLDGWPVPEDCDDTDPTVSPSEPEQCLDMRDNNRDGQIDEGCCAPGDPGCPFQCLIVTQQGCPAGTSCYLSDALDATTCEPSGFRGPGEPCTLQTECASPSICFAFRTPAPVCMQVCDPLDPMASALCSPGTTCQEVGRLPNEVLGFCF